MQLIEALQSNTHFFYGVVAFLGLFVGSFLNVVIYRLPVMLQNAWREGCAELAEQDRATAASQTGANTDNNIDAPTDSSTDIDIDEVGTAAECESCSSTEPAPAFNLSVPRSRCPNCNNLITWWQNIPVLSYLMLRGRCFGCKTSISIRYPIVEIVTMLLSLVVAWQFGPTMQTVIGIIVTWFLVAMTMIDFDHQLLPDDLTLPLMWVGLLISLLPVFTDMESAVIGAAAGYGVLWLVYQTFKFITGKEGMGYGDFKLLAAIGALLGWQALPMVILLSSLVGAVVGITLMIVLGRDRDVPIPFGPYLAAAGWIAMLWGPQINTYYYSFFG